MRREVLPATLLILCLMLFGDVAPAGASPAPAAGVVGNEFQISQSPLPGDPERPAVVYNGRHDEYLVVWRSSGGMLRGQRVSRTGARAGSEFVIDSGSQPAVAYNAQDDQYLVVWSTERVSGEAEVDGRIVSWNGSPISPGAFVIWYWPNRRLTHPRVAWNSVRDEYFVVWGAADATTYQPTDVAGVVVYAQGGHESTAHIITAWGRPNSPDITYNPGPPSQFGQPRDEYYLVWAEDDPYADGVIYPNARDVVGRRFDADGAPQGPWPFLSERRQNVDNHEPVVATNQSTYYFTAWRNLDYVSSTTQIQAKVIDLYGSPTSGVLPISPVMNDLLYSGPPAIAAPAAPWYSRRNEFLVVWTQLVLGIRSVVGSRCSVDERNLVSCELFPVRVETGGSASFVARGATASGGRGYLLTYGAWPPGSSSGPQNVYGRLLWPPAAFLPLIRR